MRPLIAPIIGQTVLYHDGSPTPIPGVITTIHPGALEVNILLFREAPGHDLRERVPYADPRVGAISAHRWSEQSLFDESSRPDASTFARGVR